MAEVFFPHTGVDSEGRPYLVTTEDDGSTVRHMIEGSRIVRSEMEEAVHGVLKDLKFYDPTSEAYIARLKSSVARGFGPPPGPVEDVEPPSGLPWYLPPEMRDALVDDGTLVFALDPPPAHHPAMGVTDIPGLITLYGMTFARNSTYNTAAIGLLQPHVWVPGRPCTLGSAIELRDTLFRQGDNPTKYVFLMDDACWIELFEAARPMFLMQEGL